jgi:hypothetical protein
VKYDLLYFITQEILAHASSFVPLLPFISKLFSGVSRDEER